MGPTLKEHPGVGGPSGERVPDPPGEQERESSRRSLGMRGDGGPDAKGISRRGGTVPASTFPTLRGEQERESSRRSLGMRGDGGPDAKECPRR